MKRLVCAVGLFLNLWANTLLQIPTLRPEFAPSRSYTLWLLVQFESFGWLRVGCHAYEAASMGCGFALGPLDQHATSESNPSP